jgi:hypothetical protein
LNGCQYLALSRPFAAIRIYFPALNKISIFFSQVQCQLCAPLNFTDTFIPSPQSPDTSFIIADTDAIGPPESHCHLGPIIWNLSEAKIKRKG